MQVGDRPTAFVQTPVPPSPLAASRPRFGAGQNEPYETLDYEGSNNDRLERLFNQNRVYDVHPEQLGYQRLIDVDLCGTMEVERAPDQRAVEYP